MLRSRLLAPLISTLTLAACATGADEHGHDPLLESAYFEAAYEDLREGSADTASCSGVRVPDRSGFAGRVALTFDDGPNLTTTPRIVEILRRRGIPATFLMNGKNLASPAAKQLARDLEADPLFLVGSHSQNHPNFTTLSATRAASEIDSTTTALEASGVTPKWFRFPYGASTCATAEMVRERGYEVLGWHVDTADWCFQSGGGTCRAATFQYVDDAYRGDMAGWTLKQIRANNGGIVLFHDVHANTAAKLEAILDAIEAAGFTFTNVDDARAFPLLNAGSVGVESPPASRAFIGTPCTLDAECDFRVGGAQAFCHEAGGFCTTACEGYCPDKAGFAPTFCAEEETDGEPGGVCMPTATEQSGMCMSLPSTAPTLATRYVGSSRAAAAERLVCAPAVAPAVSE